MDEQNVQHLISKMEAPDIECIPPKKRKGEELMKNLAVAASLVLCAVTLKNGAVPPLQEGADIAVSALTDNSILDDPLGKLSFVSSLFPETTLVFGQSDADLLCPPVEEGSVVHAWSQAEPYTAWASSHSEVRACMAGTVTGVYHGSGEELMVQIDSDDGMSCLYGNLHTVAVQSGDILQEGDVVGSLAAEDACLLEVRINGVSVDPADYLPSGL